MGTEVPIEDQDHSHRPIVAIANRLPVVKARGGWRTADGGLVTAMRPALELRGGAWVGWDGGHADLPRRVEGLDIDMHPVSLARREAQDYYYGFANRSLWPLLHDLIETPVFDPRWWEVYRRVNQRFAEAVTSLEVSGDPLFWVHDYHLMLLPKLLREQGPKGPIAYFLHTPFPAPELFSRVPWKKEILLGLLGADLVAFQTDLYCQNFLRTAEKALEGIKRDGERLILEDGREVSVAAHPISIDAKEFAEQAVAPEVENYLKTLRGQFADRKVLLGVDRLDYTKGIRHRLRAVEQLLERRADLRTKIAFVQVAVPSRDDVKEYRELRAEIEGEVGRINGRFTEPGKDVPIHYLYRRLPRHRMLAYYRLADVALVTPLKDGMNLIAKEFVVSQDAAGGSGALVISEFAGAAHELAEAVRTNPFDERGMSDCIEQALEMPLEERRERLTAMAANVHRRNIYVWLEETLADIERAVGRW